MSTAITRAQKLLEEATRLASRKKEQNQSDHFEQRSEELRTVRGKLDASIIPALVLARQEKFPVDRVPAFGKLETDLAEVLRRARDEAPDAMTRGQEYKRFHDGVSKLADAIGKLVDEVWAGVRAELPATKTIPLDQIEKIPGYDMAVKEARQLDETVKKLAQRPPRTDEEYDQLMGQVEALLTRLEQLSEKAFPTAVRRFMVEALSPVGAAQELLTEEVRAWLEKNNYYHRLRLRLIEELPQQKSGGPSPARNKKP